MSSYSEIAQRIVKILVSPDAVFGFWNGVMSVPKDIGYLAYGFIDTDSRSVRENERIRMMTAIRYGILKNHNFIKTLEIVFEAFNQYVPKERQNSIYSKALFSVAGRATANTLISGRIAQNIAQKSSLLIGIRGSIIGNALLAGGMAERCIYTSRRLQSDVPEVYSALRPHDYDFLYFLLEPALQPFVEALHVRWTNGTLAFNQILDAVDNEFKKR
ncbi:hypothetical protein COO59_16935 [Mixta theicola]|uniref:Uncharacterized protein n=1 Tax=Mixta theicola TaxID=1458355 RepID=A0A2K1Q650_9GAMM|nr:hypothetical protein [Mixta theicola]PNS10447.1 hypothetical protein COO59_16935 [Mixta theicola]GLR08305.1 hypothetical protein GCM10007905_10240 [Mixta theicola]